MVLWAMTMVIVLTMSAVTAIIGIEHGDNLVTWTGVMLFAVTALVLIIH